jgi:NAD(P) transhydrogenase subunit alpha
MKRRVIFGPGAGLILCAALALLAAGADPAFAAPAGKAGSHGQGPMDYWPLLFVFVLATFIGLGVILRVSRLLHTPLMSLTNAISAIAVVGAIIVTGGDYPLNIRIMGAIALFASMTNIVSGFLITDRMLKMFKQAPKEGDKK